MAGRIGWGILITSLMLQASTVFGQAYSPGGPYGGAPGPVAGMPVPGGPAAYPMSYGGAVGGPPAGGYAAMPPAMGYPGGGCPPGGQPGFASGFCGVGPQDELVESPFERALKTASRNSWFRLEYLNWSIEDLDETLLGTRTQLNTTPQIPFLTNVGIARVPTTEPLSFNDKNGIRGTIGIPLTFGELEISAFLLEQASDKVLPQNVQTPGFLVATTVLSDGNLGRAFRVYDRDFRASFTSDVWGGEANIILDTAPPGEGFKLQPLYGARYLSLQEQLTQVGTFNASGTISPFTSSIDSDNINNLYGLNLGLQAELVHRWFTVGARPKIMLGANSWRARVTTNAFVSPADPRRSVQLERTDFAALGELQVYGKVHVNDSLTLFVSYNLLWATNVIRPHKSIRYNVNTTLGVPVSSAFSAREYFEDMTIQGLTVGAEFRFH